MQDAARWSHPSICVRCAARRNLPIQVTRSGTRQLKRSDVTRVVERVDQHRNRCRRDASARKSSTTTHPAAMFFFDHLPPNLRISYRAVKAGGCGEKIHRRHPHTPNGVRPKVCFQYACSLAQTASQKSHKHLDFLNKNCIQKRRDSLQREMHSKKWSVDEPPKRRAMPSTGIFFVHLSAQAAELHDDVLPKHACILLQVCV